MRRVLRAAAAAAALRATVHRARQPEPVGLDAAVGPVLHRSRGPAVDRFVSAATDIGSVFGLTGAATTLALTGHRRDAAEMFLAGSAAWAVAQGTKELVDRPRPYELGIAERLVSVPAGSSWPSGHAAVAAAMAVTASRRATRPGRLGAVAVAVGVAASRLYVGVHHATDVIAGAAIGVVAADVVAGLSERVSR